MILTNFRINGSPLWMREGDGVAEDFQGNCWQWVLDTLTFTSFFFKVYMYVHFFIYDKFYMMSSLYIYVPVNL